MTESTPTVEATAEAHPPAIRLKRASIITLVVIGVAALAGLLPRSRERAAWRKDVAELSIPTVLITVPTPAKPGLTPSLPAEIRPLIEAPIYARANGYLKRWLVDIGSQVEAGQVLAEIDTPEINQELARARAELAQAQAALALSRITSTRWVDLLKTSSVSEQEAAEKQSDLALKSATVDAATANVRRLEELQSFAKVTAPFSGTITARRTDVGDLISATTAKELFRLAQTGTLRVYVHVPQTSVRIVHPGQMAELTIPELPQRVIPAKVVRTSGIMDAQSRTLLTELEVDNSNGEILAGSYGQVRFAEAKPEAVLTLPSNTLLFRAEGPQVGVVQADGTVELRSVVIGRDFGPTLQIVSGVSSHDRVIINPADSLIAGSKVRVEAVSSNKVNGVETLKK